MPRTTTVAPVGLAGVTARDWLATAAGVLAAAWLGAQLAGNISPLGVVFLGVVVLGGGGVATVTDYRHTGLTVAGAGAAMAAVAVPSAAATAAEAGAWVATVSAGLMLAAGSALRRFPAAVLGAAALLASLILWEIVLVSGVSLLGGAAVLGAVSALSLGLLARGALVASGLTRLSTADTGAGADVGDLTPVVAVVAGSAALGGVVLSGQPGPWPFALAGLLAVILLLRARTAGSLVASGCLLATGGAVVVAMAVRLSAAYPAGWLAGAAAAVVAVCAAIAAVAIQPRHGLAEGARRIADGAELSAVVAVVPVAVAALLLS